MQCCLAYALGHFSSFDGITTPLNLSKKKTYYHPMVILVSAGLSVKGRRVRVHIQPFQNLDSFVHPTLHVSFRKDTKSRWSLLPGVYARASKRSHTGKWKKPSGMVLIYKIPSRCFMNCCQNTCFNNGVSAWGLV